LPSGTALATLPSSWYSDPQVLPLEQERVFQRGWQYLPVGIMRNSDARHQARPNIARQEALA